MASTNDRLTMSADRNPVWEVESAAADASRVSLRDFLPIVFKRKHQILLFFGSCFIAVIVGTLLMTPEYRTTAQVLVKLGDFAAVKRVAQPLAGAGRFEFYQMLGQASQALGEPAEAVGYYKEYLNRMGTSIEVLNAIGDCYVQLADPENALVAWEKSLELNPNQESVKARVKALKEKR